jgi:CubicO group peptidase (beta-lactamase class C family)
VTPAPVDAARASRDEQRSDDELRAAVDELAGLEGIRTLQVWRDGEEIARRAVRGAEWGPHDVKSASKSLLSALVGIALERGVLRSVEQTVAELLPPAAFAGLGPAKRQITVEDLLTMRSGLGSTSGEHYGAWVAHRDWVRAALERPLEHPPGTRFTYSTGNSHLLSAILTHATGRSTRELFREWLGEPLGIEVDGWERSPRGIDMGGNAFRISPDELAAFGRLYLAGGTWEGRRVLPESWITASTRRHSAGWPDRYGAYGYLWWKPPGRRDAYLAVGYGGQFLYVDPPTDTLVVVTSSHAPKGAAWDRDVLAFVAERIVGP